MNAPLRMDKNDVFPDHPVFEILQPERLTGPFLFNSPHSGRIYPPHFRAMSRLDELTIRKSEDAFIDQLASPVIDLGLPLMKANFPRAFMDINREPYELDPGMFDAPLPRFANTHSIRVANGLGTIAKIVSEREEIYAGRIPLDEGLARIEHLYKPYHDALRRQMASQHVRFGYAVLVDVHSMPSSVRVNGRQLQEDIIIGDRNGRSADMTLVDCLETSFVRSGLRVARNKPYAGGFITEHYGRPKRGLHAIQVEINRKLYMNEKTLTLHEGAYRIQQALGNAARDLLALAAEQDRHAAE